MLRLFAAAYCGHGARRQRPCSPPDSSTFLWNAAGRARALHHGRL